MTSTGVPSALCLPHWDDQYRSPLSLMLTSLRWPVQESPQPYAHLTEMTGTGVPSALCSPHWDDQYRSPLGLCCAGLQNEGWLNPLLLLAALKTKLAAMKTTFITGEVVGFTEVKQAPKMVDGEVVCRKRLSSVLVSRFRDVRDVGTRVAPGRC